MPRKKSEPVQPPAPDGGSAPKKPAVPRVKRRPPNDIPSDESAILALKYEPRIAYRAFLLWLLAGGEAINADLVKALSDEKATQNHVSIGRWRHGHRWAERREALVRASLDPEFMAYDVYKAEFLLREKGRDLARLYRALHLRSGLTYGVPGDAYLDADYQARVLAVGREAGMSPDEVIRAVSEGWEPSAEVKEGASAAIAQGDGDEEEEPPLRAPEVPIERDAPPPPPPSRPRPVPKAKPARGVSKAQVDEILRRFAGEANAGEVESARIRVRELSPGLPPAMQTELAVVLARLDGLERNLRLQTTRAANPAERDVKLVDMTLGAYVAAMAAQTCKHCGKDCGHRASAPKAADLPGLLRVKRMLLEIPGAGLLAGAPGEAVQESIRVQEARKTGDPRKVLLALRDEAEEMVLVFDAALRAGPVDSGRYLDDDEEEE